MTRSKTWLFRVLLVISYTQAASTHAAAIQLASNNDPQAIVLAAPGRVGAIAVDDSKDYPVVALAAKLLADDVERVTKQRPVVSAKPGAPQMVVAGTLGHSALVDQLLAKGLLPGVEAIRGRWETTLSQTVEKPFPGVERALVIVGSDRRGTAYGLMRLSEEIGVSPWYWWADVPTRHLDALAVKLTSPQTDAPGVKYRGIFINDEDWGLYPWASKTFDPEFKNIGPKTYEKVFELLLRLRLNYIWPAMHPCSTEFGSVPENAALADKYAIVAGASHCEPMLYNNVKWDAKTQGPWDYVTNRDAIHACWEESAKARGGDEAVWTLGIRGIHDAPMKGPKDTPGRIALVTKAISDERALLDQYVSKQWGPVAQCFVPYKEVQSIYDAGLPVPPEVTLIWADDNFGYLRRLSSAQERQRPGGAGFYYHLSYYGRPHSYTWINTTAPALMWEEMHKAWENEARTIWMLNVGDLKPAEIGIDYYARLAWNPAGFGADSQPAFLRDFASRTFGEKTAQPLADFLTKFYRLGNIRKPELMNREWALSLSASEATQLEDAYKDLLKQEETLASSLPVEMRDAYIETAGFPARVLGTTGLIFLADRKVKLGIDAAGNATEITRLRDDLEAQVRNYNTQLAGGKWNRIMPGLVTNKKVIYWGSQVSWPWAEEPAEASEASAGPKNNESPTREWRDAAAAEHQTSAGAAKWTPISGLGSTARALSLEPATLTTAWPEGSADAPSLGYNFQTKGGDAEAFIDFLPTFRLVPGMQLRVCVRVDHGPPQTFAVPGGDGREDENGAERRSAVLENHARLHVPMPGLLPGSHVFTISAVDPGVVIDRLSLP